MRLTIPLAACASLALAACGGPADDAAPVADETSMSAEPGAMPAPTGDEPAPAPTATETGGTASVPAAIRGRWGLVPADCTSTRGDAKGLIEVTGQQIRFYESVATLGTVEARSPESIRADWSFTGEGSTWTRDLSLTVQNGGDKLERREYGEDAMEGVLTYTRCG